MDDGSGDGTATLAEALSHRYRIKVVHRRERRGLSSAVLDGWHLARGAILGAMDADLSHPPEEVGHVAAPVLEGRADLAVGSRYVPGGGTDG